MKKILFPLLLLLQFLSCTDNANLKSTLEKSWIAGLQFNPITGSYKPNTLLSLDQGRGKLSNIGQNKIDFLYKIKDGKINLIKSNLVVGSLDILHHNTSELTILNFQKDTLRMREVLCGKISEADMRGALLYKTFQLQASPAHPAELLYFHDQVLLSFKKKKSITSTNSGILEILPINFRRKGWELEQYGDYTSILLTRFQDQLGYPLVGLVEQADDQLINIHAYFEEESRLFELVAAPENERELRTRIIGTWAASGSAPELKINADGSFNHLHKGELTKGQWSSDPSGCIVILEGKPNFLKFCSLSTNGDQIMIELSQTSQMSLFKQ